MALWCAALYLSGAGSPPTLAAQALRDLAILGWLAGTFRTAAAPTSQALRLIQRLLAALCLAMLAGGAAAWLHDGRTAAAWLKPGRRLWAVLAVAGGLLALFVLFVIMYMAGIDQWVCIGFGVICASVLVWVTFRLNAKYGEWGLMKLQALRRHPRYIISRKGFLRLICPTPKKRNV